MNIKQQITIILILMSSALITGCGPTPIASISAGDTHTCALTSSGGVKCWGSNEYGQLGDGSTSQRNIPANVSGLSGGVIAVAAGGTHTCALIKSQPESSSGGVKCWGSNAYGQLGDGTTHQHPKPVSVSGLDSGVIAIAAGYGHNCALTIDGAVKCWGLNGQGQLGDGTITTKWPFGKTKPVDVSGLTGEVSAITAGHGQNCALTLSGKVKCWGYNPAGNQPTPVDVSELAGGALALTAGHGQVCALIASPQGASSGGVKCWGTNAYGELGNGASTGQTTPVDVIGLTSGVNAIAAGYEHTCAMLVPTETAATPSQAASGGGVKCWGNNGSGELGGVTSVYYSATPVDVSELIGGAIAITAGHGHTCALGPDAQVKCWGSNTYGQLGDGTTTDSIAPVNAKH